MICGGFFRKLSLPSFEPDEDPEDGEDPVAAGVVAVVVAGGKRECHCHDGQEGVDGDDDFLHFLFGCKI